MEPDNPDIKKLIMDAAIHLYVEDRNHFNMKRIAQEAGLKPIDIYPLYSDKYDILYSFYNQIVPKYRIMTNEIEDFNTYSAGEKISNFIYTSFDLLGEQEAFVEMTFHSYMYCPMNKTTLKKDAYNLFRDFLSRDEQMPEANRFFLNTLCYTTLTTKFLFMIEYWLSDQSESKEKSMVLVDKLTVLFDEIIYNSMLDKSFDLMKFFITDWGLEKTFSYAEHFVTSFFKRFENYL